MHSILHILNGDSTAHHFADTGLSGDVLVWREIFSQGPLTEDIQSAEFWRERGRWIEQTFGEQIAEYEKKVVDQLEKLNQPCDEINLWFEFDLHCQANLLGVLALLASKTNLSPPNIYLICPGKFPGKTNFRGMGELNSQELLYLFDTIRVELGEPDLFIAAQAWNLYVRNDTNALENWISKTHFWASLGLLKTALEAHIKRSRTNAAGLNSIEQLLLDIYNAGNTIRPKIYGQFWSMAPIFGMGDTEIDLYLQRLEDRGLVKF